MKKKQEAIYDYEAVFDPNGSGYTVTVPKLPGLVTEGDTLKEAREMTKDAIRCYLQAVLKDIPSKPVRSTSHKERIKIAA